MSEIDALMEVLAEFDAAYPDSNGKIEDGMFRATVETPVVAEDGSWTRIPFKLLSGPNAGLHTSAFLKWFGETDEQVKVRRSITKKTLKHVLSYDNGSADTATLRAGFETLRASTTPEQSAEAIARVATALEGTDVYVQVVTNKGGYQNTNVLSPDDKRIASAEAMESITV